VSSMPNEWGRLAQGRAQPLGLFTAEMLPKERAFLPSFDFSPGASHCHAIATVTAYTKVLYRLGSRNGKRRQMVEKSLNQLPEMSPQPKKTQKQTHQMWLSSGNRVSSRARALARLTEAIASSVAARPRCWVHFRATRLIGPKS